MKEIACSVNELRNLLKDRLILCFGAGIQGKRWIYILEDWGYKDNIVGIIDNDAEKKGLVVNGHYGDYPIYPLEMISGEILKGKQTCIVITSLYFVEIISQLRNYFEQTTENIECVAIDMIAEKQLDLSDYEHIVKESDSPLIPKIIHYCWFGGNMPDKLKRNIENWYKLCPDYEIKKWDDSNYDMTRNEYMYQAYLHKAWGFVSDYTRLDVIWNEGGIYLDTDIELIRSLDDLLYQRCFGCVDASLVMNLGSGFGATPKCEIIKELRDYYDNVTFVKSNGKLDKTSCNTHSYNVLRKYGFMVDDNLQNIREMNVYPMIFQGACQYTRTQRVTEKTYWIHHGNMSWL